MKESATAKVTLSGLGYLESADRSGRKSECLSQLLVFGVEFDIETPIDYSGVEPGMGSNPGTWAESMESVSPRSASIPGYQSTDNDQGPTRLTRRIPLAMPAASGILSKTSASCCMGSTLSTHLRIPLMINALLDAGRFSVWGGGVVEIPRVDGEV